MEQPIQQWKRLFPYRKRKVTPAAANKVAELAAPKRRAA
jgi:hypothetical protein